jgi:transcriptional regulator with XRE-family HTH domain
METVAAYLKHLRKRAELTQKEAAEKAGLTAKTVERWEAAQHEPRVSDIMPYLAVMGGHIDDVVDLLTGDAPDGEILAIRRLQNPLPPPDIPADILRDLDVLFGTDRPTELATRRDMVAFGVWLRDSLHDLAALWSRTTRHRNGE